MPWSDVSGWRVECECGWRGTTWQRTEGTPSDPTTEHLDAEDVLLADGRTIEDAGLEEWRRHMQPIVDVQVISTAAKAVRKAQAALDAAVAAARKPDRPATWDQIGRAAGITRQSAHDRWAGR